jgi:hypothetical protein
MTDCDRLHCHDTIGRCASCPQMTVTECIDVVSKPCEIQSGCLFPRTCDRAGCCAYSLGRNQRAALFHRDQEESA